MVSSASSFPRRPLGGLACLLLLSGHALAFLLPSTPLSRQRQEGRAASTRMMASAGEGGQGGEMDRRALVRTAGVGLSLLSGLALLQLPQQEGRCVFTERMDVWMYVYVCVCMCVYAVQRTTDQSMPSRAYCHTHTRIHTNLCVQTKVIEGADTHQSVCPNESHRGGRHIHTHTHAYGRPTVRTYSVVPPASATVAFDPDRYGDKELKVGLWCRLGCMEWWGGPMCME